MPGVVTDPPTNGAFATSPQSAGTRFQDDISTVDIKAKAKDAVNKEARGASALSLIRTARVQILAAKESELKGDLKAAFASYIKAASLAKMVLDSNEYMQESKGKGGVIRKEFNELFLEGDGKTISMKANALEEKLKAMEQQKAPTSSEAKDPPPKSIAERMRALQNSGLQLGVSKLPESTNLPTPPMSPRKPPSNGSLRQAAFMSPPMTPSTSTSQSSQHAIVPPSSLGPPSPSSTPSSSPPKSFPEHSIDLAGFAQAFPSIDELDENFAFSGPSVPPVAPNKGSPKSIPNGDAPSPMTSYKSIMVPIERPSSTPIIPTGNSFHSRPSSPNRSTASYKPSGLSNGTTSSASSKVPIQKRNTVVPKELLSYMRDYTVLLIDVRYRAEFDGEHIKGNAVVCLEPSVLLRDGMTSDGIENAMVVGPKQEVSLFANRDKFDLVVVYDRSSTSFGPIDSPLSILVRLINEQAFRKMLKRMPMMLVGGIEAWKKELGDTELVKGSSFLEIQRPTPKRDFSSPLLSSSTSPNPYNPFTNGMSANHTGSPLEHHQIWTPKPQADGFPAEPNYAGYIPNGGPPLARRPAMARPVSHSISYTRSHNDSAPSPPFQPQSMFNSASAGAQISYPSFPKRMSPSATGSSIPFISPQYDIASPPQASINPSNLSRKRSDFVDQSQEALSALNTRPAAIDYPELTPPTIVRPPPVAAPTLERQDNRPRVQQASSPNTASGGPPPLAPKPPRIASDIPVTYWPEITIGITGLRNLGNTCYMNAPIQCLSATVPFAKFFTDGRWKTAVNLVNPLGSKGHLTNAFAKLLHEMWRADLPYLSPVDFRRSICQLKSQYLGTDQHDSQEFLSFLLDGIHEDLNRIITKLPHNRTPEEEAELERLPPQIASDREWRIWRERNDSLIVDFFQGQFRNRLECLTCRKTSTTYNVFSILQLPVPHSRSSKVPIERCLDAFFNQEVLEKDDAWDCPQCKAKRRAHKYLSLARLPPVLVIHLKRFEATARSSDKIDTFVDFPVKNLDLTNYMPPPLPPGVDQSQLNGGQPMSMDDPRNQLPPYRYDLYGVTNHFGNLSSGHYTAAIASKGGWLYCDDSSIKTIDSKQVVSQRAYVLFYKRVRAS